MRLKLILMVASVGLIGAVTSGCVSESGHYRDYRPAVVHQNQPQHVDRRRDRYNDHGKRTRQDRDRSSHRANDKNRHYNNRDRASGHYKDCRPGTKAGTKDCRRPHT